MGAAPQTVHHSSARPITRHLTRSRFDQRGSNPPRAAYQSPSSALGHTIQSLCQCHAMCSTPSSPTGLAKNRWNCSRWPPFLWFVGSFFFGGVGVLGYAKGMVVVMRENDGGWWWWLWEKSSGSGMKILLLKLGLLANMKLPYIIL